MITNREKGFTLIEIAIVMVIVGLLMGGGVSIFRVLNERKTRNNTIDYLKEVKESLKNYANINGTLPNADTNGDGLPDGTSTVGTIPYVTIGVQPKDSWSRNLKYEVNASLCADRTSTCSALRNGFSSGDRPEVIDADAGAGTGAFSVAAVIVSAGPMDADSDGDVFDNVSSGLFQGDNTTGNPYIRNPPTQAAGDEFDDLLTYIGANELYGNVCEYLILAVNNNSGSTVYVYNQTQGSDIGSMADGGTSSYNILSGTRIEIRDASNGGGSIVSSTEPITPITLAGQGCTIIVSSAGKGK